jgi:hypothetical protein
MTKAMRIHQTGGPEVLRWEDVEAGEPGEGQARMIRLVMDFSTDSAEMAGPPGSVAAAIQDVVLILLQR